jgi:hypothetical protein
MAEKLTKRQSPRWGEPTGLGMQVNDSATWRRLERYVPQVCRLGRTPVAVRVLTGGLP